VARAEENEKDRILVSVSGGPDSTALLVALHMVAEQFLLDLQACHINHGLRGDESAQDQHFVEDLCRNLDIPLNVVADLDSAAAREQASEDILRTRRYDRLNQVAQQENISYIATGHTLDDQAETVLFRIFRGTALNGLAGMRSARTLAGCSAIVRPMLKTPRQECLRFLQAVELHARTDSSNSDLKYSRNFIRHKVVPLIDSRFPGVKERLERLRQIVEDEEQWLSELVVAALAKLEFEGDEDCWSVSQFQSLHPALQRRIVAHALQSRAVEVSYERVECVIKVALGQDAGLSLNQRWDFSLGSRGKTAQWKNKELSRYDRDIGEFRLKVPGMTIIPALGKVLHIETWTGRRVVYPRADAMSAIVNLSHVKAPFFVRSRREGDVIQPFGMAESVRLKKYLHTHKASTKHSAALRNVVLCNNEEVLWVPGTGMSEKLRVKGSPSHRLSWADLADDVTIV